MAASQSPSTSAAEDQGQTHGGFYGWPHSVVRWLFGLGEEHEPTTAAVIPVSRFQNICISREAGAGASALARMVGERLGWKVYDEELIEAIAHRMEVPIDDVRALDEQLPSMVQDWPYPLCARRLCTRRRGLSRPPCQTDRGYRPRGRIDSGRERSRLHAAARDHAIVTRYRPSQGPGLLPLA